MAKRCSARSMPCCAVEGLRVGDLRAVIVGTGPGAFTGLRVGLATAKTLAHELRLPLVGLPTAAALARAMGGRTVIVAQPAGPHDRYVTLVDTPSPAGPASTTSRLVPGSERLLIDDPDRWVAVDLPPAPAAGITGPMVERGRVALEGLPQGLLQEGAAVLASRGSDDVAALVPLYVTLPRGVTEPAGGMAWSPDLR